MNFLFNSIWRQHFYFNGKQLIESTCHLKNLLWVIYAIDHTFHGFTGVITHAGCWENTRKASKSRAEGEWFTSFSSVPQHHQVNILRQKTYWCDLIPEHAPTRVSTGVELGILHSFRPISFSYPESSGFLALPRWPKIQKAGYEIGLSQAFLSEANSSGFNYIAKVNRRLAK